VYSAAPPPPAPEDAAYFLAWMDRVIEATNARGGWNGEQERADTLAYLEAARAKFRAFAAR
jgi:TolB protein